MLRHSGDVIAEPEHQDVVLRRRDGADDAPVVLLDEVTSALDSVSEAAVHDGIERR